MGTQTASDAPPLKAIGNDAESLPTPLDAKKPDQLTEELSDRLIERRERLGYTLAAAATGGVALTVQALKDSEGALLIHGHVVLWLIGAILLLTCAGLALFVVSLRHDQYHTHLLFRDDQLSLEATKQQMADRRVRMGWLLRAAVVCLCLGALALIASFGHASRQMQEGKAHVDGTHGTQGTGPQGRGSNPQGRSDPQGGEAKADSSRTPTPTTNSSTDP